MNEKKSIPYLLDEIREISDNHLCWILEAKSLLELLGSTSSQPDAKEFVQDLISRLP